ncbi:MAG: thioredoxin domain-containing protein, partial [Mariprofundus sp.]|nr:thioredoxin domain-containing protein [Mariprofundus sp.]
KLNKIMLGRFKGKSGGLYQISDSDDLIARPMEIFDSALPSGNAVAMHNLLRLSRLTGDAELAAEAAAIADHFAGIAKRAPSGVLHMLSAVLLAESKSREIVLAGDKDSETAKKMLHIIRASYRPNAVVLWHNAQLEQLAPYTRGQKSINGNVTAYVCENFQCNLPVSNAEALAKLLD